MSMHSRAPGVRLWPAVALALSAGAAIAALAVPGTARAQDLANGTETARRAVHVCASCHGEGGRSTKATFPNLAGQPSMYVMQQLKDFRSQTRAETDPRAYMWGVSALLDDATIQSLAEYYAAQTPAPGHGKPAPQVAARGRLLFEKGLPEKGVRACASCHGEKAEGVSGFPRLAGQHADYLYAQLKGFGSKLRPHGVLMKQETAGMSQGDMKAVAAYLQSL